MTWSGPIRPPPDQMRSAYLYRVISRKGKKLVLRVVEGKRKDLYTDHTASVEVPDPGCGVS